MATSFQVHCQSWGAESEHCYPHSGAEIYRKPFAASHVHLSTGEPKGVKLIGLPQHSGAESMFGGHCKNSSLQPTALWPLLREKNNFLFLNPMQDISLHAGCTCYPEPGSKGLEGNVLQAFPSRKHTRWVRMDADSKPDSVEIEPHNSPKKWGGLRCRIWSIPIFKPVSTTEGWKGSGFWSPTVLSSNPQFRPLLTGLTTLPGSRFNCQRDENTNIERPLGEWIVCAGC